MEKTLFGQEFFSQMEFLWHLRLHRNNYATEAAGGNIFWLAIPDANIGDVVTHVGGSAGEVGYRSGQYTYGVVIDKDEETGDALVKLMGEVRVRCNGTAIPGMYAEAQADGGIMPRLVGEIEVPDAVIGFIISRDVNGFCRIAIGMGRECAQCAPLSASFLHNGNDTDKRAFFCAGVMVFPNMNIVGPFTTGLEKKPYTNSTGLHLRLTDGIEFEKPPMIFCGIESDQNIRAAATWEEQSGMEPPEEDFRKNIIFTFSKDNKVVSYTQLGNAKLNIIVMGEI